MIINKVITNENITLNNEGIQQINEFYYLGSLKADDNKAKKEIRKQIALVK